MLALGSVCFGQPQSMDARLNHKVTVVEPAIPLAELLQRLSQQTKVRLQIDEAWREVRVAVLARERPLHELMSALQDAFPPLVWEKVEEPDQPPRYRLQYKPQDHLPEQPTNSETDLSRIRRILGLVWQIENRAPSDLNALINAPPEGVEPQEWRLAVSLYQRSLPTFTPRAGIPEDEDPLVGLPNFESAFFKVVLQALKQLDDAVWQQLKEKSSWFARATEHPRLGKALVELYQTANLEHYNNSAGTLFEGRSPPPAVDDLFLRFWLDEEGNFYAAVLPLAFSGGEWRAVDNPKHRAIISLTYDYRRCPWKPQVPQIARFAKPLPPTPAFIRQRANWYNALGCLLLEIAEATSLSLVAPIFPFYTVGKSEASRLANAAIQQSDIYRFRLPAADLPRLSSSTGLMFRLREDWLIATQADLEQARLGDIPDTLLKKLFPAQRVTGTAWLLQIARQHAQISPRALAAIRVMREEGTIDSPVPNTPERRYEIAAHNDINSYWAFAKRVALVSYPPAGASPLETIIYHASAEKEIWDFMASLSQAQLVHALAGEPLFWSQLSVRQQQLFRKIVEEHPLAWLSPEPPALTLFSVQQRQVPIEYTVPPLSFQEAICMSENPAVRYVRHYWEQDWAVSNQVGREKHSEEVWELRFVWGSCEVRYAVRRVALGEWLNTRCEKTESRNPPEAEAR